VPAAPPTIAAATTAAAIAAAGAADHPQDPPLHSLIPPLCTIPTSPHYIKLFCN
jgi:hypothetical protein